MMAQHRIFGAPLVLLTFFILFTFTYLTLPIQHPNVFISISHRSRFFFSHNATNLADPGPNQSPSVCHFWESQVANWRRSVVNASKPTVIALAKVHGFGDRISTIYSSFVYALKHKLPLEIQMPGLRDVFEPIPELSEVVRFVEPSSKRCPGTATLGMQHTKGYCSLIPSRRAMCLVNTFSRVCLSPEVCEQMTDVYGPELSAVHSIGCPLNMLFRLKPDFLSKDIRFFVDGETQQMTVEAARARLKSYAVIALHVRTGDESFETKGNVLLGNSRQLIKGFKSCAEIVEERLRKQGKEVKWMVASDNEAVRAHFREQYAEKVVSLMAKPKHILDIAKRGEVMRMLAEWFLISEADEIVLNTYKDTFRLSAFSKFAWLRAKKSAIHVVEAETKGGVVYPACVRRDIHYGGNTITVPKACKIPTTRRNKALVSQLNTSL